MDGWSRPNHMPSHLDAIQTMISVSFRRLPRGSHSFAKQASFYVAFGTDVGGFRRLRWTSKLNFRAIFLMFFLNEFLHRILIDFWRLRTRKIAIFLRENNDFCKIGVLAKAAKKAGFWLHFGRSQRRKIDKNRVKQIVFLDMFFCALFRQCWLHFGFQKSSQKL